MRKILRGAVVLLIAVAMVFSTVAIADTQTKEATFELNTTHQGSANGARGDVIWDNGMEYNGLGASQEDTLYPLSFMCADDFHFEEDTEVCDVHWVGGYWNDPTYNQVHWPWMITFYYDDGSGERPGNVYLGPFTFDSTQYTEVLIEDTGDPASGIYYEFSVDLPENYIFPGCEKFWIVIQGVGFFPPQSGWGLHQDPITLHEAVFKGELLGFPDWTDTFDVFGYSADMCFQLTTKPTCDPSIDVEKEVWDEKNERWVDADTENGALDIPICSEAQFRITVTNTGNCPLYNVKVFDMMHNSLKYISADPDPDEEWMEGDFYNMVWYIPEMDQTQEVVIYINAHVEGPECSYDVNHVEVDGTCDHGTTVFDEDDCWVHAISDSRTFQNPILNFLQSHPNMFPLLQILLQRLGLF